MFLYVILIKTKGEVHNCLKGLINMVKTQFEKNVKTIRSDNGLAFLLKYFYEEHGILHQRSCVSTTQQNTRVERRHQHILNISKALMFQSNIPKVYWSYVVQHALFFINIIPTKLLNNRSSYEVIFCEARDLNLIKTYGCLC